MSVNIYSDTFTIKFDNETKHILIIHPDHQNPIVTIRPETLDKMDFTQAAQFLGERLLILIPQLQERYADDLAKLRQE